LTAQQNVIRLNSV